MRWLHRSYFLGAGASHFLLLRVCPAGFALLVVMVAVVAVDRCVSS
jgi:hypothetical protein